MFGKTYGSMFGRTLLEYCVQKNTFRALCSEGHFSDYDKLKFLNNISPINFKMDGQREYHGF